MPTQRTQPSETTPPGQSTRRSPSASSGRSLKYALLGAALAAALAFTVLAPALQTADAAKGGNGGGKGGGGGKPGGGGGTWTGSFSLVHSNDADGDGVLSHGDQITFNATSNATYYFVTVTCVTDSGVTLTQEVGLYPEYPFSRIIDLFHWYYWTSGGANCTAVFWASNADATTRQTLGTMSFVVVP